ANGSIHLILGPMFAGKTSRLINEVNDAKKADLECVVITHDDSHRFSTRTEIVTHALMRCPAISLASLSEVPRDLLVNPPDLIAIDEGQFFSQEEDELLNFCEMMANMGVRVVVAGLSGTFHRTPFWDLLKIIPCAEEITHLNSRCSSCVEEYKAVFTQRTVPILSDEEVQQLDEKEYKRSLIGGEESYAPCCRRCW
ncbi:hypothetical protein CAPTEDRAFT_55599, partial [Capitella teleta]